jgi:DNA-binding FadR family transcriptional regulator
MMQEWDPQVTPFPIMPENFVAFYESYIPVRCALSPEAAKAAFEALARRDQHGIELAMDAAPFPRAGRFAP